MFDEAFHKRSIILEEVQRQACRSFMRLINMLLSVLESPSSQEQTGKLFEIRIDSVKWAYEKILSPCCSIVFSGNPSWKRNCSSYSCLSPAGFQFAGLVEEVLGSALKKLNAAHSVRDHHTRAVAGATVRLGLNHFETMPTTEVEAATTIGELKHRGPSTRRWSTASALGGQKGAHSAKE